MTYKLKEKKYNCQLCKKEIDIKFISNTGAPRKYCINCTKAAQKQKDLQAKRIKRLGDKVPKLLSQIKKDPQALNELKNVIEEIGRLQQQSRRGSGLFLFSSIFAKLEANYINPLKSSSDFPYDVSGKLNRPLLGFDDKPQQWSERELVELVELVVEKKIKNF